MKSILVTLGILIGTQSALAKTDRIQIDNAEVVVFDATCIPTSPTEGYLNVNLQVRSSKLFFEGNF